MRLFLFVYLITGNKTNNISNQIQKCLTECGKRVVRCHRKKGLKNEIQLLTEENLTPPNVARFSHAGRQRLSGAPLSPDIAPRLRRGLRATSAFGGRPA